MNKNGQLNNKDHISTLWSFPSNPTLKIYVLLDRPQEMGKNFKNFFFSFLYSNFRQINHFLFNLS